MRDPMLERMRLALSDLLPWGAFLKRDRGSALFVTDAPRRGACPDWSSVGFLAREADGLACLTPDAGWLAQLEARWPEPPDLMCAQLRRGSGPVDGQVLELFAMGLKILDGGPFDPAFDRRLRQLAAVTLREQRARGGLYACGLVRYEIEKERGS